MGLPRTDYLPYPYPRKPPTAWILFVIKLPDCDTLNLCLE